LLAPNLNLLHVTPPIISTLVAQVGLRVDGAMTLATIECSRSMSFSFWDALILEAALRGGADRLLTKDPHHGQKIEDLTVENPFLEAGEI
jgi:predicted nucleic acid-binding protein